MPSAPETVELSDIDKGETVPLHEIGPAIPVGEVPSVPNIPPTPLSVAESAVRVARKVLPRVGTQVGGAEVGAAIGALGGPAAPVTVPVGAAIGGGIGNVIGARLPEAIGGDPTESTLHAFGWGAVPEGIARGISGALERRVARKGAEAAHDAIVSALDKGANVSAAEQAGGVATAIGRRTLESDKPLTGDALSTATGSLRQDILDPITEMRRRLGEPIGDAYKALKADPTPLDPDQIKEIQEASSNLRDSMLSPYPKARAIFNRIKTFSPPEPPEWMKEGYTGEHPPRAVTPEDYAAMEKYVEAVKAYKPPTWDDLRELRQVNNQILRAAKGGDAHASAGLQQAIDEQFMATGKLPADIDQKRALYREFMNRFPWRDVNKVNQMGTPRELTDYAFGGTPERTAEIVQAASPQGKIALREALTNRALDAVNPDAPLKDQVAAVRKILSPYIKNGTAASLYGTQNANDLREIFYAPEHLAQMKEVVQTPEFKDAFTKEVTALMRSGNTKKLDAVEAGFNKIVNALPENTRNVLLKPTVPGVQVPALPSAQQAMETGLRPGESNVASRVARRAEIAGPMAVGRAALGSPLYAAGQLVGMAGIATTSAGYRAIMENGGAGMMAKVLATPSGRMKARLLIEGLAALGTQAATQPSRPTPTP